MVRTESSRDATVYISDILCASVRKGASDIHFERFGESLMVRFRVDGRMLVITPPEKYLVSASLSLLKTMANLDATEVKRPQEGVIREVIDGRRVEFRVSALSTQNGESIVLRVLDGYHKAWVLEDLSLPEAVKDRLNAMIEGRHGLLIVCGPTGSGKTTTLYSLLRSMDDPSRKLISVEDPVECSISGVTQVAVRPDQGLDFARCIRSFLRHDPDVIMVGEIRDAETARVAVQAALTGHMVLSTLHANDASSVPNRLIDLGVEPSLVAASLLGVLAQRLVRKCDGATEDCGRVGIFEFLEMTDEIRSLVLNCVASSTIRNTAQNMRSLMDEGERLVCEGKTTMDEVLRVLGN